MTDQYQKRIDRLRGKIALQQEWELFKGKPEYDPEYVDQLDVKIQKLKIELGFV